MKNKNIFTLIIPINNGDSTIEKTFSSIIKQKNLNLIKTIILINDASTDKSEEKKLKALKTDSYCN